MQKRNSGLDSLRWLAVTLVVMSHCNILKQGGVGNDIFFTLSGFLAVMPFVVDGENRFLKPTNVLKYYASRFVRIIPVFWICILTVWLLIPRRYFHLFDFETDNSLILNLFFIRSRKHLWFLQQEVVFYALCPFLLVAVVFAKKLIRRFCKSPSIENFVVAILLAAAAVLYFINKDDALIKLKARERIIPFVLDQFLIGMAFGYLYRAISGNLEQLRKSRTVRAFCNIYLCLFIPFCILSSRSFLALKDPDYVDYLIGWKQTMLCGALSGVFIIALLLQRDGWFSKIFGNKVCSYLGRISYEIYIIHVFMLKVFDQSAYKKCLIVYIVTIGLSIMVHNLIEKPCIVFAKNFKFKDVVEYYKAM